MHRVAQLTHRHEERRADAAVAEPLEDKQELRGRVATSRRASQSPDRNNRAMSNNREDDRLDLSLVQRHLENVKRQVVKQWNEMQYGRIKLQLKVIIREKQRLN